MLCEPCSEHFRHSLLPPQKCLEFKLEAVEKLRTILREPNMSELEPHIHEFENEVMAYRQALHDYSQDNHPPCPWSRQNLSWLPSALEQSIEIDVWEEGRPLSGIVNESSRECELCVRLDVAVEFLGDIE